MKRDKEPLLLLIWLLNVATMMLVLVARNFSLRFKRSTEKNFHLFCHSANIRSFFTSSSPLPHSQSGASQGTQKIIYHLNHSRSSLRATAEKETTVLDEGGQGNVRCGGRTQYNNSRSVDIELGKLSGQNVNYSPNGYLKHLSGPCWPSCRCVFLVAQNGPIVNRTASSASSSSLSIDIFWWQIDGLLL